MGRCHQGSEGEDRMSAAVPALTVALAFCGCAMLNLPLRDRSHADDRTVAFGTKRTCRGRGRSGHPTRLTHSRQRLLRNPAVQSLPPYLAVLSFGWAQHPNTIQNISGLAQGLADRPTA